MDDFKGYCEKVSISSKGPKQILIDRLYDYVVTTKAEEEEIRKEKERLERIEREQKEKEEKEARERVEREKMPEFATLDDELAAMFPLTPVVVDRTTAPSGTF